MKIAPKKRLTKVTVSINADRQSEHDFTLGGRCQVIDTEALVSNCPAMDSTLILHANDIRDNPGLRKSVLARAKTLNWDLVLFTTETARGPGLASLREHTVFTWQEIQRSFPRLLSLPHQQQHLAALSILCQGFLVAYCESQNGNPQEAEAKRALRAMGWPKLGKHSELRKRLQDCWHAPLKIRNAAPVNPQDTSWWLLPFKLTKVTTLKNCVEQLDRAIKREWDAFPRSISELIGLIRNGNTNKPEARRIVAKAYLDLTKHLETWARLRDRVRIAK